jgi:hypothetical protein
VEHVISNLLKRYEGGALSRRDLVKGLAMLTAGAGRPRPPDSRAAPSIMSRFW